MAPRKIPDISRGKIQYLYSAFRVHDSNPHGAFDYIGPFGRIGVPMKFSEAAGF